MNGFKPNFLELRNELGSRCSASFSTSLPATYQKQGPDSPTQAVTLCGVLRACGSFTMLIYDLDLISSSSSYTAMVHLNCRCPTIMSDIGVEEMVPDLRIVHCPECDL